MRVLVSSPESTNKNKFHQLQIINPKFLPNNLPKEIAEKREEAKRKRLRKEKGHQKSPRKDCLFDLVVLTQDWHPSGHISFGTAHGMTATPNAEMSNSWRGGWAGWNFHPHSQPSAFMVSFHCHVTLLLYLKGIFIVVYLRASREVQWCVCVWV